METFSRMNAMPNSHSPAQPARLSTDFLKIIFGIFSSYNQTDTSEAHSASFQGWTASDTIGGNPITTPWTPKGYRSNPSKEMTMRGIFLLPALYTAQLSPTEGLVRAIYTDVVSTRTPEQKAVHSGAESVIETAQINFETFTRIYDEAVSNTSFVGSHTSYVEEMCRHLSQYDPENTGYIMTKDLLHAILTPDGGNVNPKNRAPSNYQRNGSLQTHGAQEPSHRNRISQPYGLRERQERVRKSQNARTSSWKGKQVGETHPQRIRSESSSSSPYREPSPDGRFPGSASSPTQESLNQLTLEVRTLLRRWRCIQEDTRNGLSAVHYRTFVHALFDPHPLETTRCMMELILSGHAARLEAMKRSESTSIADIRNRQKDSAVWIQNFFADTDIHVGSYSGSELRSKYRLACEVAKVAHLSRDSRHALEIIRFGFLPVVFEALFHRTTVPLDTLGTDAPPLKGNSSVTLYLNHSFSPTEVCALVASLFGLPPQQTVLMGGAHVLTRTPPGSGVSFLAVAIAAVGITVVRTARALTIQVTSVADIRMEPVHRVIPTAASETTFLDIFFAGDTAVSMDAALDTRPGCDPYEHSASNIVLYTNAAMYGMPRAYHERIPNPIQYEDLSVIAVESSKAPNLTPPSAENTAITPRPESEKFLHLRYCTARFASGCFGFHTNSSMHLILDDVPVVYTTHMMALYSLTVPSRMSEFPDFVTASMNSSPSPTPPSPRATTYPYSWRRLSESPVLHNTKSSSLYVFVPRGGTYRFDFFHPCLVLNRDILVPANDLIYPDPPFCEPEWAGGFTGPASPSGGGTFHDNSTNGAQRTAATHRVPIPQVRGGRPYLEPSGWTRKGLRHEQLEIPRSWAVGYADVLLDCADSLIFTKGTLCTTVVTEDSPPLQLSSSLLYITHRTLFRARSVLGENADRSWSTLPFTRNGRQKRVALMVRVEERAIREKGDQYLSVSFTPRCANDISSSTLDMTLSDKERIIWEIPHNMIDSSTRAYGLIVREYEEGYLPNVFPPRNRKKNVRFEFNPARSDRDNDIEYTEKKGPRRNSYSKNGNRSPRVSPRPTMINVDTSSLTGGGSPVKLPETDPADANSGENSPGPSSGLRANAPAAQAPLASPGAAVTPEMMKQDDPPRRNTSRTSRKPKEKRTPCRCVVQ